MFAALGVKVTLVDARESILGFLDHEMVAQLSGSMRRMGIELRLGLRWRACVARATTS
jgi:NAD(P) transhydrogenase